MSVQGSEGYRPPGGGDRRPPPTTADRGGGWRQLLGDTLPAPPRTAGAYSEARSQAPYQQRASRDDAPPSTASSDGQSQVPTQRRSRIVKNNAPLGSQPSRQATPIQSQEERSQQLLRQHKEQMRMLAMERQQIQQRQSHFVEKGMQPQARPQSTDSNVAATRKARRMELIEQLMDEQDAAHAALESLKEGRPLAAAREIGYNFYHQQQLEKEETAKNLKQVQMEVLREAFKPQLAPPRTAGPAQMTYEEMEERSHLRSALLSGYGTPRTPIPANDGFGKLLSAPTIRPPARDLDEASSIDPSRDESRATSRQSRTPLHTPSRTPFATPHHTAPRPPARTPARPAGSAGTHTRHGIRTPGGPDEFSSPEVTQLKEQVKSLQSAVEAQMFQNSEDKMNAIQAQQAAAAAAMQQQQQAATMGFLPMAFQQMMMMAQNQMNPQKEDKNGFTSLAPELQHDEQVRAMHADHIREMTLLRMEIDRAKTATELEQIKAMLADLKHGKQQGNMTPQTPVPATPPPPPPDEHMYGNHPDDDEDDDDFFEDGDNEEYRPDEDMPIDENEPRPYENEDLDQGPPMPVENGGLASNDTLLIGVGTAGPFTKPGSYRIRAILYDGFQPLESGDEAVVGASTRRMYLEKVQNGVMEAKFHEKVVVRGLSLTPTMLVVFELFVARKALLGMPSKEMLVAWAYGNVVMAGKMVTGVQHVPMFRLPLMIDAQRKFSFDSAMIDFTVEHQKGEPGDIQSYDDAQDPALAREAAAQSEDVPGVPSEAWMRVTRGVPPADPYVPGEGFVVMLDGARFLPANCTISKVVGAVWSTDRRQLTTQFEAVSLAEGNAYMPRYSGQVELGTGTEKFDHSTATLLFTVFTVDKWSRNVRSVGYAVLNVFVDPKLQGPPTNRSNRDYVLNTGSFQLPLHVQPPPSSSAFTTFALDDVPRVPCASILLRIMSPANAKLDRRKPVPLYSNRVYDSMRDMPTPTERKLYTKYLQRRPLMVREGARFLVSSRPQYQQKAGADYGKEDAEQADFQGGDIPSSDMELMDWMERRLEVHPGDHDMPLNYNFSSEYFSEVGFMVACDGACRLERNLPAAALITFAPPGSFYQDNPIAKDVKVTLDYDMGGHLSMPVWTDGYQLFTDVMYEPGLAIIFDVRLLVPSTGTSAPAGWAALPLFEPQGAWVASGAYHLPLFKGIPSRFIIQEWGSKGDVEAVISAQIKAGRLKAHEEFSGVLVRVLDASRSGQRLTPATQLPQTQLKLPTYLSDLGPKHVFQMRKEVRNKTYSMAKPKDRTDEAWIEQINDTIIKVAGLDIEDDDNKDDDDDEAAAGGSGGRRDQSTPPLEPRQPTPPQVETIYPNPNPTPPARTPPAAAPPPAAPAAAAAPPPPQAFYMIPQVPPPVPPG